MIRFAALLSILALSSCAHAPRACVFGESFSIIRGESEEKFTLQDVDELPAEIGTTVSNIDEKTVAAWYRSDAAAEVYTWDSQGDMRDGDIHRFLIDANQYTLEETLSWFCNDELRDWNGPQ